jgi:FAD-dependent urate hydroxylase
MAVIDRQDVVVVGAGPYGLSAAAHLGARGLRLAVFGKPLELWRHHMPKGMFLRSHVWATNLSDPERRYGFERFLIESRSRAAAYPVPIDAFIEYGEWFQERAVPKVDRTYVASIARTGTGFHLTLQDGRRIDSTAVVMAVGVERYAHRPFDSDGFARGLISHTCDHGDLASFRGRSVIVVGGGQSALESAALLHENGARVTLVSRRPIVWLDRDRTSERSLLERLRAPANGLAPGWVNWVLEKRPYLFYRLPQPRKDHHNRLWSATAAAWLRERVNGNVALHEGQTIVGIDEARGRIDARLSNGTKLSADHLLLATGYRVDVDRLPMIDASLRTDIATERGVPILTRHFESSVPGLYFVGLSAVRDFGPLYRFVAGCPAAARRVAAAVSRRQSERTSSR